MNERQVTEAFFGKLIAAAERQGWEVTQTARATWCFHTEGMTLFWDVYTARDLVKLANGLLAMGVTLP